MRKGPRSSPLTGYDILFQRGLVELRDQISSFRETAEGDSEIERLFITALYVYVCTFNLGWIIEGILTAKSQDHADRLLESQAASRNLIVVPQRQRLNWRVDFEMYYWCFGDNSNAQGWKTLIVECDGHDFHERTKEQAKKDRSRDREAQLDGATVFRFTGSEIYRDAWGCAAKIVDWAERVN